MRLAVHNVENLFDRAKVMNLETWADGKQVLERYAELNKLLGQLAYRVGDKKRMARLLGLLGLDRSDKSRFVRNRGKLLKRPPSGGVEIIAEGRATRNPLLGQCSLLS